MANCVTIATLINPTDDGHYMEVISYNHQYNCRHDPSQPFRGKVSYHGNHEGVGLELYEVLNTLRVGTLTGPHTILYNNNNIMYYSITE